MKSSRGAKQSCDLVHAVDVGLTPLGDGVPFQSYNILDDADLRQGLKEFSNWPTIPQLYVKGELVGGCDIVREMYETGELQQLMSAKGIPLKAPASV